MESIIAMAQVMEGFEVKEGDPYKQLEALGRAKQTCHGSRDSGLCSSTCKMACYSEHLCAMAHDGIITVGTGRYFSGRHACLCSWQGTCQFCDCPASKGELCH